MVQWGRMRGEAMRCDAMRGDGWMRARDRGGVALVPLAAVSQLPTGTLCGGGMNVKMEGRGCNGGEERGKRMESAWGVGQGAGEKATKCPSFTSPFCRKSLAQTAARGRVLMIHIPTGVPEKRHQDGTASSFRPLIVPYKC
jgi:hypothetical protein